MAVVCLRTNSPDLEPGSAAGGREQTPAGDGYSETRSYPIGNDRAITELKRDEMGFLLLTNYSPALGIALLLHLPIHLDLGLEYLNRRNCRYCKR